MKVLFWLLSVSALALGLAGLAAGPASAGVLSEAYVTVREGGFDNALVGFSVGTAGDVNGDGYSDVLLNGSGNNGTVWCYHGAAVPDFAAPDWTVSGGDRNWLGSQVSTAGDINGDGYYDVMVGAPVYTNGEDFEGAVYVYLGSASGLSDTPQIILEPNIANTGFGGSIDTAADVNGDGFDDILIGAYRYTDGQTNEGRLYVYYGSPQGISSAPGWTYESDIASAGIGLRVSGTGDVNADGYADILASAPDLANGQNGEGRVYLFLGSANGPSTTPDWTYESNVIGGRCGWGLGFAGDVNGDGYSDITFDTGSNNPATGAALLFLGGPNGPGAVADRTFPSNHGGFADNLYTAGDLNGDGFADLVATEEGLNNNTGSITILGGWETGAGFSVLDYRDGQQAGESFGAEARTAGDVNGDGFGDVIVGAPRYDNTHTDEGAARLYFGKPSLPSGDASVVRDGGQTDAMTGYSVAQGDWNGDGHTDLAVGSPYWNDAFADQGAVQVYYGSATGYAVAADWMYLGSVELGAFGYAVANAGDVDNDGYEELLVGEPFWGEPENSVAGRGHLFMGSPDGLETTASWVGVGEAQGGYYGMSLAGAGDVNGDGYGDVLVGAPMQNNNLGHGGKAFLYYGSPAGLSEDYSWGQSTGTDFDEYGRSVAGAGDVNGDGYSDIVIGAPGKGPIADEGYVYVHFGTPQGPTGSWILHGDQVNARYGSKVAAAGDVNGDGYSDILVGAPDFDGLSGTDCGLAEVHIGQPDNSVTMIWQQIGATASDRFGFGLGGGGDVNNDGYSDVVIGAPWINGASPDGGGVYLFLGSAVGTQLIPAWMRFDTDDWSNFGYSVNLAGDVTGDGFADIAIGQPFAGNTPGRFSCFYGGREIFPPADNGSLRLPRQVRTDESAPVALLGTSDAPDGFKLSSVGRSARGRGRVRLEYQISPVGTTWADASQLGDPLDTGAPVPGAGSGVLASATVTGLDPDTRYHWRARFRSDSPHFPTTPWFSIPGNAALEADLRTGKSGSSSAEDVDPDGDALISSALRFSRVAPNPSRYETSLTFMSPAAGRAHLTIHDASGRRVATLLDDLMQAGSHAVQWDLRNDEGREVPAGIYLARLAQGPAVATTKLIVRR